jgi:hypothetical protein
MFVLKPFIIFFILINFIKHLKNIIKKNTIFNEQYT